MQESKRFKTTKIPVVLLLAVGLQSCFVAKEYSLPENMIETNRYRTDYWPQDSVSMATVSWKEMFPDPQLQEYISEGLQNNIDIRVAVQQIYAAEAYFKQGKAGYLPAINGQASAALHYLSENGPQGAALNSQEKDYITQYEMSGTLSWEADLWGKIRSNKRALQASFLQTVAAHKAVKTRLIANIASLYFQLLALDEQVAITESTIATREKSLETIRALKEAGNVTEVGVQQTEAQLYAALGILLDLNNRVRLMENTLSILLGRMPGDMKRTLLENQIIETKLATGVPLQLLRNRPDVVAAELQFRNAFELTNMARSNFYPSLTLSGSGGLQSLELDKLFNGASLFASVAGNVAQPVFNRRKIRTGFEVSQARLEQALLNFKQSLLTASREVSDAMYSYETATEKIKIKEREYEAYNLAATYSEELLNSGLANYLEVLRARENALNARLDVINAKNSRLQAIISLYEALGGGWQ